MTDQDTRKVIASVMVSLDGFTAGPGGDQDVMWFVEHAATEQMGTYFEGVYRGANLVDELRLNLVPTVVGGGLRLFGDGLPRSDWDLAGVMTLATGALGLHYTRQR